MSRKPKSPELDKKRIFSTRQCEQIRDSILNFRKDWIKRPGKDPVTGRSLGYDYFTLFSASYVDVKARGGTLKKYRARAKRFNPLLRREFGPFYRILSKRLETLLGDETYFPEGFALPGFHVYVEKNGVFGLDGSPHFDTQHLKLDWSKTPLPVLSEPISFTVPIILPSSGSGLQCWDTDYAEFATSGKTLPQLIRGKRARYFRYSPGRIFLMRGLIAHKIPDVKICKPGDLRITLQGHAIRTRRGWAVYW